MRLSSFKVRGFKNLTREVALEELGPVNVLHGPNNVGKSNVLQAMQVFFRVLRLSKDVSLGLPVSIEENAWIPSFGVARFDAFNLEQPAPITMAATIDLEESDLTRAAIAVNPTIERVTIEVTLRWMGTQVDCQVTRFDWGPKPVRDTGLLRQLAHMISYSFAFAFRGQLSDRFTLIGVDRVASHPALALRFYDAKESDDLAEVRRWERFVESMRLFEDILGKGAFVVTYDRSANAANLLYQTANARIPFRLLGSGVQQIAALVGDVLMTPASLVGIEEPELNLRYSMQERLREVFLQIVGAPGGPSQIFLTSHSPAFESGPTFYFMSPTPDGPVVERRKVEDARVAVDFPADVAPPEGNAVRCYISTEGVVRVPQRIMSAVGLPQGGGVMFVERDGAVEMMSDERFVDELGLDGDGGDAGGG